MSERPELSALSVRCIGQPPDEADVFAVEVMPGNYMAFFEPWDNGDYDT